MDGGWRLSTTTTAASASAVAPGGEGVLLLMPVATRSIHSVGGTARLAFAPIKKGKKH